MALTFPASPSENDTHTEGSITYKWDGAKWIGLGVTPADRLVEGSNNLEINSSNNLVWTGGNVGIGVEPIRKLDVAGNSILVRPNNVTTLHSSGNADAVNNSIIVRCPYGENAATVSNAGNRFGIQFTGANNTTDIPSLNFADDPFKSASIYGVSEDDTAGYSRKVGMAFYTSNFDIAQAEQLRITGEGNVILGHTAANARLQINSGTNAAVSNATNPAFQIGGTGNYRFGVYTTNEQAIIANKNGDDGIAFYTKTGYESSFGEALRITSNGNVSLSSGQVVTPNTSGSLAARNRIDNGAMEVAQRGGAEITIDSSTSEYVCDRWAARGESGDAFLYDQDSSAPYGFKNSLKFNCSNTSGGGSNQLYTISQAIEGYNVADFGLGGGSSRGMSISFWVKASIAGDWGGSVQNENRDRSYNFVYNIAAADDWEYKTVYIPGPTSGSWNNDTGVGIRLNFDMGNGSNFRGNAGSWLSADTRGPSGAISPMQTLNSVWRVTGVQLEMGPAATPFEYRGYPIELVRCKRYYQRIGYGNHLCITNAINNNAARIPIPMFPVEMRAQPAYTAPTLTEFSAGTAITPSSTHQPSKNGGGYIQLPSSPTNGMYLKLIANAELT